MYNTNLPKRLIMSCLFLLIGYLYVNGFFHKIINSLNPNFYSSNPKSQYSQVPYPIGRDDSGRRLSSEYFNSINYNDALKIDKPILFFTYTPSCPVSNHVKELIYPISEQYKNSFTFVVLKPPGMTLSIPPEDPVNDLLMACNTPICVFNKKKNFLLSLNVDITSTTSDIIRDLNEFLERSNKM